MRGANTSRFPHQGRPRRTLAPGLGALSIALGVGWLGGCASPAGVVFDPGDVAHQWPLPPDAPRIRYVGQLLGEDDLKPGRGGLERMGDALFGKTPGQTMVSPMGVCTIGARGAERVFIADSNAQCVHVLDLNTRRYARWASPPTRPEDKLVQPVALAYDPGTGGGRLLVSDSAGGNIATFNSAGAYTGTFGDARFSRPCGLAVDSAGRRVFVADAGAHQIVVLSDAGHELARIGERGSGLGQFNYPTNVALDKGGRLYVSDSLNFRVQVFGPDLKPIRQIGSKGDLPGYFSQPKGLALDPDDHLYVVDANFEAVQLFDSEGRLLMSFGREGHGPGEFWLPAGIWIDASGRIWVADSYNRRVQVFDSLPAPPSQTEVKP